MSSMVSSMVSSIGARHCLRLRPPPTSVSTRCSVVTRVSKATRSTARFIHTVPVRAQSVEVANRAHAISSSAPTSTANLIHIARTTQSLVDPTLQALGGRWFNRVELLTRKAQMLETVADHQRVLNRVMVIGSSLSQTQQLLKAMIDEPLREIGAAQINEADSMLAALSRIDASTPFTIKYAPGPLQLLDANTLTLDRHWLQQSNFDITVLIDPTPCESTYDLIYDSEAVLFVTDDYAISRSAHRSHTAGARGDAVHELVSRFAAKPNIHLVVNSIIGSHHAHIVDALEAATGASVSELIAPNLVSVRISDALAANSALRQALDKSEQPSTSQLIATPPSTAPSTAFWDEFSRHYQQSNVGSLIDVIHTLESRHGSRALAAQSAAFLLRHCVDEALAIAKRNLACLHQLRSLANQAQEQEQLTLKRSLERIWPPTAAYTGQLSTDDMKTWRPAAPGSQGAVGESMQQTDAMIESAFDTKLQWWKLIWKVDDVRKELESACAGFAASLESDLAYESGRLATLQVEQVKVADQLLFRFRQLVQELAPSIESASRDMVLLTNIAESYRSSKLRVIEPSTLMEPIHRRRAQLLQTGGPIDVLASKSRKLAVTSLAAVAVTAAGVGSASVLGTSLVGIDASAAAIALDPSTGLGLGLLTLTLVGWRMQGQYNKYRRRFRQDWQRISKGLDQDLKSNFERTIRNQISGPTQVISSHMVELAQTWSVKVKKQQNYVQSIAASCEPIDTSNTRSTSQQVNIR
ncbi:uncharacterized protein MEPE_03429 [Melanopsichium pennsylvanicum]|uniref:Mmc1 C-terminal domain-containing protein n=2 Tax=Melanopsichium pennsylvanicum TaxID=63383 RepID=A0AAJ5C5G7_9BASI|nr:conserved hypothetical protein [Melanopsichium pennsylvanicum 4]SNX84720.1 uncharacterized protein MEPE_03429 [Melanopsichium pennsylvanicum]